MPVRSTSWTYDATGQVLTETDPRGKVVVTNEYYTDTTAEHTKGDLKSSMNSAGHHCITGIDSREDQTGQRKHDARLRHSSPQAQPRADALIATAPRR